MNNIDAERELFEAHMDANAPAYWRTTAYAREAWDIWKAARATLATAAEAEPVAYDPRMRFLEGEKGSFNLRIDGLSMREIKDVFHDKWGVLMWSNGAAYPADKVTIQFTRADLSPTPNTAPAAADVAEPVYQILQGYPGDPEGTWRDATKTSYDRKSADRKRVLYATPPTPTAAPAQVTPEARELTRMVEGLLDIWDDSAKPHEYRAYQEGAFSGALEEIRAVIAAAKGKAS